MGDDLWYPDGVYDPAPSGVWGVFTDAGEPKFLLHTTESAPGVYNPDPFMGAGRRYYGNTGTWPNYTLAWHPRSNRWRVYNHIPANRSSLSLRNPAGGVETNRDNVTQVEIATRAVEIRALPGQALDELAKLLAWEHLARGVPLTSTVRWVAYPASYGERASQRLSGLAWDAYSGVLGHQHCPENSHGDPGDFPIQALLSRATDIVRGDHVTVTDQDRADIAGTVMAELTRLMRQATSGGKRLDQMAHGSGAEALGIAVLGVQELRDGMRLLLTPLAGDTAAQSGVSVDAAIAAEADPLRLAAWVRAIGTRLHAIHAAAEGRPS